MKDENESQPRIALADDALFNSDCDSDSQHSYENSDNEICEPITVEELRNQKHECDFDESSLYSNVVDFTNWITKVISETVEAIWSFINFKCTSEDCV